MTGLTPMTYSLIFGTNSEYKSLLIVQKTLQLLSVSLSLPLLMHNYQEKKILELTKHRCYFWQKENMQQFALDSLNSFVTHPNYYSTV